MQQKPMFKKYPIGGCSSWFRGAKIVKLLAHSITYRVRGLSEFLYLYKRT